MFFPPWGSSVSLMTLFFVLIYRNHAFSTLSDSQFLFRISFLCVSLSSLYCSHGHISWLFLYSQFMLQWQILYSCPFFVSSASWRGVFFAFILFFFFGRFCTHAHFFPQCVLKGCVFCPYFILFFLVFFWFVHFKCFSRLIQCSWVRGSDVGDVLEVSNTQCVY